MLKSAIIRHQVFLQRLIPGIIDKSLKRIFKIARTLPQNYNKNTVKLLVANVEECLLIMSDEIEKLVIYEANFMKKLLVKNNVTIKPFMNKELLEYYSNSKVKLTAKSAPLSVSVVVDLFAKQVAERLSQIEKDAEVTQLATEDRGKQLSEFLLGSFNTRYKALVDTLVNNATNTTKAFVYRNINAS